MKIAPLPTILEHDDLFALHAQECADCGATFQTSRRASRCALCASLRSGQVGPATVQCPVCDLEHQVPILAPHKLCGACVADLDIAAGDLRARLDVAQAQADAAWLRLDADLAHADETDRARYDAACEAKAAGVWKDQPRPPAFFDQQWAAAIARADGLSPLLAARLAWDAAAVALDAAQATLERGMDEIARAK